MPCRFARGSNTKASARFDALRRVMLWLASMASGRGLGGFVGADRGKPAGFSQGRVARPKIRMLPPLLADAHAPATLTLCMPVSAPHFRPGARNALATFAAGEIRKYVQRQRDDGDDTEQQQNI